MRFTMWLCGCRRVRITGTMLPRFFTVASKAQLPLTELVQQDEFTAECILPLWAMNYAEKIAARTMCTVAVLGEYGIPSVLRRWRRHKLLALLLMIAAVLPIWLSGRIWFYEVEGNQTVPTQRIIREVAECGVPFGAEADTIDPQMIKNSVLCEIPELEWLTVVHRGCRAIICVRERPTARLPQSVRYGNLIAVRDGVITEIETLEGAAAVRVGERVSAGDVLISGEVPLERTTRICVPKGEVYAATTREKRWATPKKQAKITGFSEQRKNIYLLLQKKRIKIFSNSGNFDAKCGKMTETKNLTLPGGWTLPVQLCVETVRAYQLDERTVSPETAEALMTAAATAEAKREMIDGTVLSVRSAPDENDERYEAQIQIDANEMIARQSNMK